MTGASERFLLNILIFRVHFHSFFNFFVYFSRARPSR